MSRSMKPTSFPIPFHRCSKLFPSPRAQSIPMNRTVLICELLRLMRAGGYDGSTALLRLDYVDGCVSSINFNNHSTDLLQFPRPDRYK